MSKSYTTGVGAFVIGGLALFTVGLFMIGDRRLLFEEDFEVYAEFQRLNGLESGAVVRVAGMNAGEVTAIEFPPGPKQKFRVRMRVRETLHPIVRGDSVALIQTDGLLGSKLIEIGEGSEQSPPAADLSAIDSREPFDFADLMERLDETAKKVDSGVDTLRTDLEEAFDRFRSTAGNVDDKFNDIAADLRQITTSGKQIADNISVIIANAKAGEGTVGQLLTDRKLYDQATEFTEAAAGTTKNLRQTSEHIEQLMADIRESRIVPEAEQTVANLRKLTEQVREAVAKLSVGGEGMGMVDELRDTVADAREAVSDLADNTEAMKHNFFTRGFFKRRGFYDLDSLTYAEYREGKLVKKYLQRREWLHRNEIFSAKPDGSEQLTPAGEERLDKVMAEFLRYPRNSPIMIEGYAGQGSLDEIYIRSQERATLVKKYLVRKFQLDAGYVGVMPISSATPDRQNWDGVSLVLFYPKDAVLRP
ncbi:MAG: MlaD family protein [Acidobacteria bacterium]|nr:MlaD family protein [Acidobacteriota bacterium]